MWSDSVVDPGLSLLGGLRDSSLLGGTGTLTAWRTPGLSLLGGLRDPDRNWTGESDRCDRTRLDPELELMFLSRIDVIGLGCGSGNLERNSLAGSGTLTAWRTLGPSLLGGVRDLHCLAESGTFTAWRSPGPSLLGGVRDPDRNWTGESDRCDRTRLDPELELMFLSWTDVVGLSCGSGTFTAWWTPGLFTTWRNRDLDSLADSGTFTAWRTPGP